MDWYYNLMKEIANDSFADAERAKYYADELVKELKGLQPEKVDIYKYLDCKGYTVDEICNIVAKMDKSTATQKEIDDYLKYKIL